eukprot:403360150
MKKILLDSAAVSLTQNLQIIETSMNLVKTVFSQQMLQNQMFCTSKTIQIHCLYLRLGSGVVINSLQMILKKQNIRECIYYGVDINQKALDATRRTAQANQCQINLLQMNFCDNMVQRMKGQFDILIFNPPYVVTPQDELIEAQQKQGIEASWAGGEDGIEVLMKFIPQSYELISENGAFYLLLIEENLRILKKIGKYFDIEYLVKRECPGERQIILRLTKKKQNL